MILTELREVNPVRNTTDRLATKRHEKAQKNKRSRANETPRGDDALTLSFFVSFCAFSWQFDSALVLQPRKSLRWLAEPEINVQQALGIGAFDEPFQFGTVLVSQTVPQ
jgi:hypothetical protein